MTVRILDYPDLRLKQKGASVSDIKDAAVQHMIEEMFKALYAADNCCGLASTQLDFESPLAITVIDVSENKDEPFCFINPKIIEKKGKIIEPEGCMSVYPNYIQASVERAVWVKVEAQNEKGETIIIESDGLLGKCLQHELDHLQGRLYIDLLSRLKRERLDKKIEKVRRHLGCI